jgi:hypothetical protein
VTNPLTEQFNQYVAALLIQLQSIDTTELSQIASDLRELQEKEELHIDERNLDDDTVDYTLLDDIQNVSWEVEHLLECLDASVSLVTSISQGVDQC